MNALRVTRVRCGGWLISLVAFGCAKPSEPPPPNGSPSADTASAPVPPAPLDASPAAASAGDVTQDRTLPPQCAHVDLDRAGPPCMLQEKQAKAAYGWVPRARDSSVVKVDVTIEPNPIEAGARIAFQVVYRNTSDGPVAMTLGALGDRERFAHRIFDKDGVDPTEPRGASPCCDPRNPTLVCNGVPVVTEPPYGLLGGRPDTVLLAPHGVASVARAFELRRHDWGPRSRGCPRVDVGPVPAGRYSLEVELPVLDGAQPDPPRIRLPFAIGR